MSPNSRLTVSVKPEAMGRLWRKSRAASLDGTARCAGSYMPSYLSKDFLDSTLSDETISDVPKALGSDSEMKGLERSDDDESHERNGIRSP